MNAHTRQRALWWVLVVITVVSFTTALFLRRSFSSPEFVIISFAIYAIVGALVSWRRAENPIGWVFLWIGVLTGLAGLSGAVTQVVLAEGPPIAWWGVLAAWYDTWFWNPLFVLATVVTFLLYPSGLASPRWRPVLWLTVAVTCLGTALQATAPTLPVGNTDRESPDFDPGSFTVNNPFSPAIADRMASADQTWWWSAPLLVVAACGLAAVASAILRTVRASGVERQQMRLFAFSIALLPIYILGAEFTGFSNAAASDFLFAVVLALIPTACGVAILRYHLYDIDRIIGRTTAYAMVTAVLLATYAVVVTSLTQVVPDSGSTGAPASWREARSVLSRGA
jgi:hypothetical protein